MTVSCSMGAAGSFACLGSEGSGRSFGVHLAGSVEGGQFVEGGSRFGDDYRS